MRFIWALPVILGVSVAGAAELEQASDQASALARDTKTAIANDPCRQGPALDAASFIVRFPAGAPAGGVPEYTVRFASCEIQDRWYGEPIEPRAVRRYFSEDRKFGLVLTTEAGSDKSSIALSAVHRGTHQLIGYVAERGNRELLSSTSSFADAYLMELDGVGGRMRPRAVAISPVK